VKEGENADLCAWQTGDSIRNAPAGKSNIKIGDRYYRLQQTLTMSYPDYNGYCTMGATWSAGDDLIAVQSAVYGENCTPYFADATQAVGATCNGQASCSVTIDADMVHTYAGPPECARSFTVQWACWDGPKLLTVPAEAVGQTFTLSCPAP
jgi:hypothetical protein